MGVGLRKLNRRVGLALFFQRIPPILGTGTINFEATVSDPDSGGPVFVTSTLNAKDMAGHGSRSHRPRILAGILFGKQVFYGPEAFNACASFWSLQSRSMV